MPEVPTRAGTSSSEGVAHSDEAGCHFGGEIFDGVAVDEAEQQLARHGEALRGRGLECEEVVREGYPATVIVDEADNLEVDLVVIGTHGHTGLKHLLLGSVAQRVVQKAPCPVLTVNPAEAPEIPED